MRPKIRRLLKLLVVVPGGGTFVLLAVAAVYVAANRGDAPSPDVGDKAQSGLSRSGDAPAYFLPNLYYARPDRDFWPGAGMPVARVGNALMPVPATDPRGIPARLANPLFLRGGKQIQAQHPNPTWQAWRTGG